MGVRGLKTFLETIVPDGMKKVQIEQELKEFQNLERKSPLVLIDLQALAYLWSSTDNLTFGMRSNIIIQKANQCFERFKNSGAKLAFFEGGSVHSAKENYFLKDRHESKQMKVEVIRDLESGMGFKQVLQKHRKSLRGLSTIISLLKEVAHKYGTINTPTTGEKHTVMAGYSNTNQVFAIVGNDTNFLIYCGKWRYWNVEEFEFESFMVKQYNAVALRGYLNLTTEQMPLFATLSCNQIIDFEDFKIFHGRNGLKKRYEKVSNFVRQQRYPLHSRDLERITKIVFQGKPNIEEYINKITLSLDSYNWRDTLCQEKESNPFLNQLLNEEWNTHYQILKNFPAIILSSYIDLQEQDFLKPFSELALTILKRHMGILWQHKNNANLRREVYVSTSVSRPVKRILVEAEYPKFEVPPLDKLIFRSIDDCLDKQRYDLLKFIIGPNLDVEKLFSLDDPFIPTVVILYYFVKEAGLEFDEADILLLSVFNVIHKKSRNELEFPKNVSVRAFKIVFLFIKFQRMVLPIFASLGFKHLAKHVPFDGLYFHILWQEWHEMDENHKGFQRESINKLRLYDD
uniref:CSON003697 protein n=1 Tax=Culicoides sonorensis TaxID=179676 RepID=A0A336LIF8_CULSO